MKAFIVTEQDENQRVDKYIMKILDLASKSFIYKMLRKKNIKLNGSKIEGHEIIHCNDELTIYFADETFSLYSSLKKEPNNLSIDVLSPHKQSFDVLYEDEHLLVCNKPIGLLSQPDGTGESLTSQIEAYLDRNQEHVQSVGFRPGICNRLDRNTSGIVLAGKNVKTLQVLNHAFACHQVEKVYLTIVQGEILEEGILEGNITKDKDKNQVSLTNEQGDYIKTYYKPLKVHQGFTLLEVKIETGKTHQIRLHLSSIGHPIVGDYKYGDKKTNELFFKKYGLKHHLLHAYRIQLFGLMEPIGYLEGKIFICPLQGITKKLIESWMDWSMPTEMGLKND